MKPNIAIAMRRDYKDGRVALRWCCRTCSADGYVSGSEEFAFAQVELMKRNHKCGVD